MSIREMKADRDHRPNRANMLGTFTSEMNASEAKPRVCYSKSPNLFYNRRITTKSKLTV